jgi:hypothetical protein
MGMSRPAAIKKPVAMCCVSIAHNDYLLPADKGMKLVELLQSAFETRKDWGDRSFSYQVGDQPHVEFCLVKASQIKPKRTDTNDAGQLLLGGNN